MDTCVDGEAFLPIPVEDEFILMVKHAVGHLLSWPRHLVIRCSDLAKVTVKPPTKLTAKPPPNVTAKAPTKVTAKAPTKVTEKPPPNVTTKPPTKVTAKPSPNVTAKPPSKLVKGKAKEIKKEKKRQRGEEEKKEKVKDVMSRKRTRGQQKERIRVESSRVLKLSARIVDAQLSKERSIKVQCEDGLFAVAECYTYITWNDFEVVFTMDKLTGSIITGYMMHLYEEIKNGGKKDHGICFVSPSSISDAGRMVKFKKDNEASRSIACRLSTRKDNHIILMPYNPGEHWVLAVLDMQTRTRYYLDSLGPLTINSNLKEIVESGLYLHTEQSGSNEKANINWINVLCPLQPGFTECGYYVLKFMKAVVDEGLEVLKNNFWGKNEYTNADLDEVREDWVHYVTNFVYE